jgi:GNAT superfamily N-acetyltransferase
VLLARLAVDEREHGHGLGAALLRDAMSRTLLVSEEVAVRVLFVDAKDDEARAFYEHFGFEQAPHDPLRLMVLLKDVRASLGR